MALTAGQINRRPRSANRPHVHCLRPRSMPTLLPTIISCSTQGSYCPAMRQGACAPRQATSPSVYLRTAATTQACSMGERPSSRRHISRVGIFKCTRATVVATSTCRQSNTCGCETHAHSATHTLANISGVYHHRRATTQTMKTPSHVGLRRPRSHNSAPARNTHLRPMIRFIAPTSLPANLPPCQARLQQLDKTTYAAKWSGEPSRCDPTTAA